MKKAFTLAEVLITLGIIGVVAAITIPSLIANYQKRVIETTLKEDYSIMAQVNRLMIANEVDFDMSAADGSDAAIQALFVVFRTRSALWNRSDKHIDRICRAP